MIWMKLVVRRENIYVYEDFSKATVGIREKIGKNKSTKVAG